MKKSNVYSLLESKMIGYSDLKNIKSLENGDRFKCLNEIKSIKSKQIDIEMVKYTKQYIFVRKKVWEKLRIASDKLRNISPDLSLQVVYGYRTLEIQNQLFLKFYNKFKKLGLCEPDLLEKIHRFIAVPEVSGHTTGGAIDVQIVTKNKPLDFGTKIWEFKKDSYTFSPFISKSAFGNRILLRDCLTSVGFAPFDGEWWHFSYGDKEWAKYYKKPYAIFDQKSFKEILDCIDLKYKSLLSKEHTNIKN